MCDDDCPNRSPTSRQAFALLMLGAMLTVFEAVSHHPRLVEPKKEAAQMTNDDPTRHRPTRWETFRFSVVGPLLAAPPPRGTLQQELRALAQKTWRHPITGERTRFGMSTIERWYYRALGAKVDPVGALRRKVRCDLGQQPAMPQVLRKALAVQHKDHPRWSYQLHADNLAVVAKDQYKLADIPSYSTVLRFMKAHGMLRRKRRGPKNSPGGQQAEQRFESREVRSFESSHVHALYHCDFHSCSRSVVTRSGQWVTPVLLGVLDDRSRVCCHAQWYLEENTENFVHGLCQAFQKRALPRSLMSDNGGPMTAGETEQGLERLGVNHDTTLSYSPEQNGKQECFWCQVEGRLMAMLEGVSELTLSLLNEATCAWVEQEYNREHHSEINESPLSRYIRGPEVGRPCPGTDVLRRRFCIQEGRQQRRSDGTVSIQRVRYEIPNRYRHFPKITVRYARWDLSHVWMVDAQTDTALCPIYPQDKEKNANGRRRSLEPLLPEAPGPPGSDEPEVGMAPLLSKLMADYAETGLPPAYLPKDDMDTEAVDDDGNVANDTEAAWPTEALTEENPYG
jgi:putative transposase